MMRVTAQRSWPRFDQENIVLTVTAVLFVIFAVTLKSFLTTSNILSLIQNVAILGVLSIAMAETIVGRGIDLSIVSNMAVTVAFVLQLCNLGWPTHWAVLTGLGVALAIGLINGALIAYVGIPAIFATLAMGTAAYGFVLLTMLSDTLVSLQGGAAWFKWIGSGRPLGIPSPVIFFAAVAGLMHLFLRHTVPGRFIYAMGDSPAAARTTGVPMSRIVLLQYLISAAVAYIAGIILATSVNNMETRITRSNLVYDVILVVAIGGISLSGGKGKIRSVLVGTLLIGTLLNGLTIMDVQYELQNIIKSVLLLIAIIVDSILNPRDEQTSQQGDI